MLPVNEQTNNTLFGNNVHDTENDSVLSTDLLTTSTKPLVSIRLCASFLSRVNCHLETYYIILLFKDVTGVFIRLKCSGILCCVI